MNGKKTLYIDQFGNHFVANTVASLRAQIANGGSRISRMFADKNSGATVHIGYVIGRHWLTAYQPVEMPI